jgi:hypothetical protein
MLMLDNGDRFHPITAIIHRPVACTVARQGADDHVSAMTSGAPGKAIAEFFNSDFAEHPVPPE